MLVINSKQHSFPSYRSAEPYETTFIIKGILGEKIQKFVVKGQGTLNGHFEALVNIWDLGL